MAKQKLVKKEADGEQAEQPIDVFSSEGLDEAFDLDNIPSFFEDSEWKI